MKNHGNCSEIDPTANHHRTAFTLLEMIIALALIVGLMGAVMVFYRQTMDMRDALIDTVQSTAARRLVMEKLSDELRAASGSSDVPFLGQTDSITFVTAMQPDLSLATTDFTDAPPRPQQDLQRVGYRLRYSTDDAGNPSVDGMERTSQSILDLNVAQEGNGINVALMTAQIKFMSFRYWDGTNWNTTWTANGLPRAVEITLGTDPLPDGKTADQYPFPVMHRMIALPTTAPILVAASQPTTEPDSEDVP